MITIMMVNYDNTNIMATPQELINIARRITTSMAIVGGSQIYLGYDWP